ncbi:MAG: hypothetical protein FWF81_02180, partial [Defluviitaleaceae bacterium]|nr:hypothetical protein [Defluviitaleaceae bacterium]
IVYVDETGIDTFIHREFAYSKRGTKVISRVSGRKYKRVGIVAAKSKTGILSPLQDAGFKLCQGLSENYFVEPLKNVYMRPIRSISVQKNPQNGLLLSPRYDIMLVNLCCREV